MSAIEPATATLATFSQMAERAGCSVRQCRAADLEQAGWWAELFTAHVPAGAALEGVAVAQSLASRFAGADRLLRGRDAICTGDPAQVLRCAVGVSDCALAVAETGSLLLVGGDPADRLIWLLPPISVLLVSTRHVLPVLDDAMAWLQTHPQAAATLVTGPSRTSDVERVLTIGVQGPREVIVVLVTETGE